MSARNELAAVACILVMLALASAAWAHGGNAHGAPAKAAAAPAASGRPVKLADTLLRDQDGRALRLASDAVGDKVVVVTFVYTHCTDICPLVSRTFARLQDQLGVLLESRVRLISLTVDPARDTPSRLKDYASLFGAKPGWLWLTGGRGDVAAALQGFGVHVADPANHPAQILVGDPRQGRWTRLYDTDDAQSVLAKVTELLAASTCITGARGAPAGAASPGCVAQPG